MTEPKPRVSLHTPGEIVASVPTLLGFTPERSVVVLGLTGTHLTLTTRIDSDPLAEPAARTRLVSTLTRAGVDTALIIVIDPHHRALRDTTILVTDLKASGVFVRECLHVNILRTGQDVLTLEGIHVGVTPEIGALDTAYRVHGIGGPVAASRTERVAVLDPVAPLPPWAAPVDIADLVAGVRSGDGTRTLHRQLITAVTTLAQRDALIAAAGDLPSRVVFLAAAAAAVGLARTQLLVLGAVACWCAGDGMLATEAVAAALAITPDDRLGQLVSQALAAGMSPDAARALVAAGEGVLAGLA